MFQIRFFSKKYKKYLEVLNFNMGEKWTNFFFFFFLYFSHVEALLPIGGLFGMNLSYLSIFRKKKKLNRHYLILITIRRFFSLFFIRYRSNDEKHRYRKLNSNRKLTCPQLFIFISITISFNFLPAPN